MKKSVNFLAALLLDTLFLSACRKKEVPPVPIDTLLFGSFYGECQGEQCIEIYKLDFLHQTISEDTADVYPSFAAPYNGQYVLRDQAAFKQAQRLLQQLPNQLLSSPNNVIGAPDARDQGGYYVEVSQNGQRQFWLIDADKTDIPVYLHAFTDSLKVHIRTLQ